MKIKRSLHLKKGGLLKSGRQPRYPCEGMSRLFTHLEKPLKWVVDTWDEISGPWKLSPILVNQGHRTEPPRSMVSRKLTGRSGPIIIYKKVTLRGNKTTSRTMMEILWKCSSTPWEFQDITRGHFWGDFYVETIKPMKYQHQEKRENVFASSLWFLWDS